MGIKAEHYRRAASFLRGHMGTDVFAVQANGASNLVMSDQER